MSRHGIVLAAALLLLLTLHVGQIAVGAKSKNHERTRVAPTLNEDSPLSLQVTPRMGLAGIFVQALVRVYPHAENRLLRISVESSGYFRSSDVALDGDDAAISHFVPLRALPAGSYEVLAIVYGSGGERARSLQKLELRPRHEGN